MDNIIKFTPKEKIFTLRFTVPHTFGMRKTGLENITLEISNEDHTHGTGVAQVPATSKDIAKKKLSDMIDVLAWVEDLV